MTKGFKRTACASFVAAILGVTAAPAFSETLFKIVTVKDEIIVGLNDAEMAQLGNDAGAIAKSIVSKGTVTLWQYASKKAANGELQQAPLQKVGVMANYSLRVEPYKTPLKVLAARVRAARPLSPDEAARGPSPARINHVFGYDSQIAR